MKCLFLGGAEEVGASCALVELGEHRFLIDCGIRMGASPLGPLPDFSLINDFKPHAVFLTHAHMDHSGSLPLYLASCPDVPVFVTPPTAALLKILFADALKIMEGKGGEDIPLYSEIMVEACLNRLVVTPFEQTVHRMGGEVAATFRPAGHILGAATLSLASAAGKVLFTGDYSMQPQKTVPGAAIPRETFDLVVTEATYGARFHPPRAEEEKRLALMVADRIRQGGFVLIPAFAIGRAQEVILTLTAEMAAGRIPPFPVYVDGMVTRVCHAYADFPNDVSAFLQKRIQKLNHPFFPSDGVVKPVYSMKDRQTLLQGPPAAIVASSGMLSGGPSVFYASELAGRRETLIAVTGYQDEESPGRKLLSMVGSATKSAPESGKISATGSIPDPVTGSTTVLATAPAPGSATGSTIAPAAPAAPPATLQFGKNTIAVACRVDSFGLSAHADGQEIGRFLSRLRPEQVALVHGDDSAREELWGSLKTIMPATRVHLPRHGEPLEITTRPHRRPRPGADPSPTETGLGKGRWPEDEGDLHLLRTFVLNNFGHEKFFTGRELFTFFCGPTRFDAAIFEKFRTLVRESPGFASLKKRPFLFQAVPLREGAAAASGQCVRMEQNSALAYVRSCFGPEDRFLRAGLLLEEDPPTILLTFAFPEIAKQQLQERLDEIAAKTGFAIRLDPETRVNELTRLLRELLPPEFPVLPNPSFYPERRALSFRLESPFAVLLLDEAAEAFNSKTGFVLEASFATTLTPLPKNATLQYDSRGRLEINTAYAAIEQGFQAFPGVLLKRGKKGTAAAEHIELSFVTPEAGLRYREIMFQLEQETGWTLKINRAVNQAALLSKLEEMLRPHGAISGNPSIHGAQKLLKVKFQAGSAPDNSGPDRSAPDKTAPDSSASDRVAATLDRFCQETGFAVELLKT
jgi:Cft2 family RNA processing exonuclease